jgi:BMFP domain-containing protein YqiC
MQTRSQFIDDITRVASGAVSTVVGVKGEIDALVRQRVERLAADLDLVTRDEFEAARRASANAGGAGGDIDGRVAALEAEVAALRKAQARGRRRVGRIRRRPIRVTEK